MAPDLAWIVGIGLTILTVVGGAIARDRALSNWFADKVDGVRTEFDKEAKSLHERINRVRDEYTRRADLDNHVRQVETALQNLTAQVQAQAQDTNKRLDNLLAALVKHPGV